MSPRRVPFMVVDADRSIDRSHNRSVLTDVIKTEDFMMYCTTPKHFDSEIPRSSVRKKYTDGILKRR
ncbi:hypothetical protein FRACYDRAFT_218020 [Fragilariopsis cylindrus CCMP1102]|uniref:Uncharacterized protein n=1 Tax=Fragilariopsis cylindrus CCMP1102 TaxID=635003 RepID=A0A1E7FF17_9STRA|nr:hypothetical protein FRACYDRAFT_218020 [Fragilariopsis cylindrus CCMP1102]|eukprot:OEU16768.1 hypothetical protein FRACYDRAFT_218020 [Fragilariopsis cylindrus CCMP1102]